MMYPALYLAAGLSLASSVASSLAEPGLVRLQSRSIKRAALSELDSRSTKAHGVRVPLTDWIRQTDLQWYSTIEVGTPAQTFTVMYDTGSTALVLPQRNCTTCGKHTLFDPAESTSFSSSPGEDVVLDFSTGATTIPIAEAETANCTVVTDTVSLGGLKAPGQMFALCHQYPEAFEDVAMDGILGMGIAPQSDADIIPTFWSLYASGQLPEPVFSFYLLPGSVDGAELKLGGIDHSKYEGHLTYVDLNKNLSAVSSAFVMDLQEIHIDGKPALTRGNYTSGIVGGKPAKFRSGLAALDTGTSFLQTPDKQSAWDIYQQISPHIKQIDAAGAWGAPCDILDSVAPTLKLAIGDGDHQFQLTLPRHLFNLGEYPGLPGICQAAFSNPVEIIQDPSGDQPVWLLGSPVLKAYYTVWDGLNMKVGFAHAVKPARSVTGR
ncbi:hypothetical protein ARAM_002223 [Aspergillus rambellii]|uniref:Peptidase A1 domain-containing protein n=1 Tax=Aspergillus rambellii TaxID=308745 RepID=A0A0F8US30_9EURO|nr:hypothetical protein ARAM_002223 [Aspergillus rambellii]